MRRAEQIGSVKIPNAVRIAEPGARARTRALKRPEINSSRREASSEYPNVGWASAAQQVQVSPAERFSSDKPVVAEEGTTQNV